MSIVLSVLVVLLLLASVVWVEARYLTWREGDRRRRQEREAIRDDDTEPDDGDEE